MPPIVEISTVMKWYKEEQDYLWGLHLSCLEISKEYMKLYVHTHRIQTKLRLPAIVLSSCSGVASFGSSGFEPLVQKWISITVGVINVGIAILQTYESYLKIGDIVSKSLTGSQALKKLADDIICELSLPIEDRDSNGVTFLREAFGRYQAIVDNLPPLEHKYDITVLRASEDLKHEIHGQMRAYDDEMVHMRNSNIIHPKDRTSERFSIRGHATDSRPTLTTATSSGTISGLGGFGVGGGAAGGTGPTQIEVNVVPNHPR